MNHDLRKTVRSGAARSEFETSGFEDLLHPARAFAHPFDVVEDTDLTLNEKRAILASWASDACAATANPALRLTADGSAATWDDIMDALKELDLRATRSVLTRADPELFWQARRGLRFSPRGGSDFGPNPA
jgi:hypothetical protein